MLRRFYNTLTHVDASGKASMVNVGHKDNTLRKAVAGCTLYLGEGVSKAIRENTSKKGDVLTVSRIAGIHGAKLTSSLIPLCHQLNLTCVKIEFNLKGDELDIISTAETVGNTGVELEAYMGANIAALTVIDMTKAISKKTIVSNLRLLHKSGGKSGEYNLNNFVPVKP